MQPATESRATRLGRLLGRPVPRCGGPTRRQGMKGGYEEFGFKNQGRCIAFVHRAARTR